MSHSPRRIAAFDFDGTLTRRDTLGGFLVHVGGRPAVATALLAESTGLAQGLRNDAKRDAAKERVLGRILRGRDEAALVAAGVEYAAVLPRRFRPDIAERVAWHHALGHELVIVSASLVYYLRPVAESLGFDHVIGVEMEVDGTGRLTGALTSQNVRAAEKERRLRAWIADTDSLDTGQPDPSRPVTGHELWAYGNSSGDDELLAMSDHPIWVGKRSSRKGA